MILPEKFIALAEKCPRPLYLVGGSVRDFLCGSLAADPDWDMASSCTQEEFVAAANGAGFSVKAVYPRTGTVRIADKSGLSAEFTRFRHDSYKKGRHTPVNVEFTDDIEVDARRRDFCCNAVYYDISAQKFVDPLGGIEDIRNKILRTVAPADKVFGEDGLRVMRLARQAAQTGFTPDRESLAGARHHAQLIRGIAPERVCNELMLLLFSDEKKQEKAAPYRGLCILRDTGVLQEILPELALGKGIHQDHCFHDHDVLEHSFRAVLYSPPNVSIRLAALLHDVGKPYCYFQNDNFRGHEVEGERIAQEILTRLRAPTHIVEKVSLLVRLHMLDFDLEMYEGKIRYIIVQYYSIFWDLLTLKQANFSAAKDELTLSPVVAKWRRVYDKMKAEGAPFTIGDLAVDGNDALAMGVRPRETGIALRSLLYECVLDGRKNNREYLLHALATF